MGNHRTISEGGDKSYSTPVTGGGLENSRLVTSGNGMVYSIVAYNDSASDVYLHVYLDTVSGSLPAFPTLPPVKITAGNTYYYDWALGRPMNGIQVFASSASMATTNPGAAACKFDVLWRNW